MSATTFNMSSAPAWATLLQGFVHHNTSLVIVGVVLIVAITSAEIGAPHVIGRLVSAFEATGGGKNTSRVTRAFLIVLALLVAQRVLAFAGEVHDARFATALHAHVRDAALRRMLDISEANQEAMQAGDVIARFVKLPWAVESVVNVWRGSIVPALAVMLVGMVYVSRLDPLLGLALLPMPLLYTALVTYVPSRCVRVSAARDAAYNVVVDRVHDVLGNLSSVYSADMEDDERARVAAWGDAYARTYEATVRCYLPAYGVTCAGVVVGLALFLWRLRAWKAPVGKRVAALLVALSLAGLVGRATSVVKPLVHNLGILRESQSMLGANASDMSDVSDGTPVALLPDRSDDDGHNACAIRLSHVTVLYGRKKALDDVSVCFSRGTITLLEGSIGSGKSSTIKVILGFIQPTSGYVSLESSRYSQLSKPELRARIAYVPQAATLFDRSVIDNLLYGSETTSTRQDAIGLLAELGLGEDEVGPLDANVGRGGTKLSGGQRQVVLFARALLRRPEVLLLDEPTASLDASSKARMVQLMRRAQHLSPSGLTIIVVSHDPFMREQADHIVRLQAGKVVVQGDSGITREFGVR